MENLFEVSNRKYKDGFNSAYFSKSFWAGLFKTINIHGMNAPWICLKGLTLPQLWLPGKRLYGIVWCFPPSPPD